MVQILNRQPVEGSFGESFDKIMNQVTQMKMQTLLEKHQLEQQHKEQRYQETQERAKQQNQVSQFSDVFQRAGFSPQESQMLAMQQLFSPKNLNPMIAGMGEPGGQGQQSQLQNVLGQQQQWQGPRSQEFYNQPQTQPQVPQEPMSTAQRLKSGLRKNGVNNSEQNRFKNDIALENLDLKKEAQAFKQDAKLRQEKEDLQKRIKAENLPGKKRRKEGAETAIEALNALKDMRQARESGKVWDPWQANYYPEWAKTTETGVYEKRGNDLASALLDKKGAGIATGFKIKFMQSRKPGLRTPTGARPILEDSAEEEARVRLRASDIEEEIISKNGGDEPKDLDTLVSKQLKQEFPDYFNPDIGTKNTKENLKGDLSKVDPKDPSVQGYIYYQNGIPYESNGKDWVEVKGNK